MAANDLGLPVHLARIWHDEVVACTVADIYVRSIGMAREPIAAAVRAADAEWTSPLEDVLFGTSDPDGVASIVDDFLLRTLGAGAASVLRYNRGTGIGVGVRLDDEREIFMKVHRQDLSDEASLKAINTVQRHLVASSFPAPEPLATPSVLGRGVATVDVFMHAPPLPDLRSRTTSLVLAGGLVTFVEKALSALGAVRLRGPRGLDPGDPALWPVPHDFRFDFAATREGAEWIDDAARRAKTAAEHDASPEVIGHIDWRPDNVAFDEKGIVAVFDWDSVVRVREATLVGIAAAAYRCTWEIDDDDPFPTFDESARFVRDYESARGRRFRAEDLTAVDAAYLYAAAYGSRCSHADRLRRGLAPGEEVGWQRVLRERLSRGPLMA